MRVQFFPTCLVELLRPDVGASALGVLREAGHDPEVPAGTTCCGQPAYNAGYAAEARRVARRTLRALGDNDGRTCVVASGSCATMMSHHWPDLFEGTPDEPAARRAAARTVELTAFLTGGDSNGDGVVDGRHGDPPPAGAVVVHDSTGDRTVDARHGDPPAAGAVVVHDSCHALRELGAGATVRRALTTAGHTTVDAEGSEQCCGFGGSFSVKLPGVSVAMADEKLDHFAATDCEQVTSCDLSCLLHLQGRAARRGMKLRFDHVATLLDRGA